ncbi:MAG TPA: nucleotide exchange factor GrpE [Candidatus Krumholzibacteria bacterium]|nr:nucleotide exchange factor GrpE [Candidatus Krumholzibacteria bacterium]
MKDKEPQPITDVDNHDDDTPNDRVYDLDSESVEPVAAETEESAAAPEEEPRKSSRLPIKISRKDILDRFQEKNSAITKLSKEKQALEKQLAGFQSERAALEAQAKENKDRWLRTAAEFENYRKRSAKEWELLKQQSKTEVVLEMLNTLDDFERAFATLEGADESEFVRGIRLIYNNLLTALQKLGVGEIDAHGAPFDPSRHMAIGQIETSEVASGHVAQVAQKGYALNGSVIRPARVVVAK